MMILICKLAPRYECSLDDASKIAVGQQNNEQ